MVSEVRGADIGGKEKTVPAGAPPLFVRAQASARHDAVDMRMMGKGLAPGVQDGQEADARAEMFRVGGDSQEGLGAQAKNQVVEQALVLIGHGRQFLVGNREDDVIVFDGQELGLSRLEPSGFGQCLAFRTMPVSAGIVGNDLEVAGVAFVHVPAERLCATRNNVSYRA